MSAHTLSEKERHILEHSTGWDSPRPLYRNHFCTGETTDDWATIQALCARGLMKVSRKPSELSGGDTVFAVTEAGIEALKHPLDNVRRLIAEARGADDFEADEGAELRRLAPLAAADLERIQLWEQRARNAEERVRELERGVCNVHGDIHHGKEAEELRRGLEVLLEDGDVEVRASQVHHVLDSVDARDSLAYCGRAAERLILKAFESLSERYLRSHVFKSDAVGWSPNIGHLSDACAAELARRQKAGG